MATTATAAATRMMKTFVDVVKNDADELVTAYESNPEFGYIHLRSEQRVMDGQWMRKKTRSTLLRSKYADLVEFLEEFMTKDGRLPGKIVVREFLEDALPEQFKKRLRHKELSEEDVMQQYIKTAGKDGPELLVGDKRILRFADYVMEPTPEDYDIVVQHDNTEEVEDWRETQNRNDEAATGKGANLPGDETQGNPEAKAEDETKEDKSEDTTGE